MSQNSALADRNLLFGILAVQVNFIGRDALIAAMNAWLLDKSKPLGQILLESKNLTEEQLSAVDQLIQLHLKAHDGSAELTLRSVKATAIDKSDLVSLNDLDIHDSVLKLGNDDLEQTQAHESGTMEGGRYQKLRHHAGGGLGDVFVANDAELHREVALKEIKPVYADRMESRLRFVLEAEITGGLEHPGIIPIYGLGAYEDGRPYYAMRFIRGHNLKEAIQEFHSTYRSNSGTDRSLAFRGLIRRYIDVCNAVAYAHSRGVLHRDLKPANVMLGKFGETLVVDWGLAKAGTRDNEPANPTEKVEHEQTLRPASGSSIEATTVGTQIGSPPYMSPEQAEGKIAELGPASDIFSLGTTLYVLLTGQLPFDADTKEEILAKVRRCDFTPPRQVDSKVPGALNAICCKAMSPLPSQRYSRATDLAQELERWLADEPVLAYPEPILTKVGRLSRKNRTAFISAVVFLLCTTIGLSISNILVTAEQRRTADQKKIAEGNLQLANEQSQIAQEEKNIALDNYKLSRDQSFSIIQLIEGSEADIASRPSLHKTRKGILELVANACDRYLKDEPNNSELRQRSAKVYRYCANVHRLTDEIDSATPRYLAACEIYEKLCAEFPSEPEHQQLLAETRRDWAKLQSNVGHLKQSQETFQQAIASLESLVAADNGNAPLRKTLAATLGSLANLQYKLGAFEAASQHATRSANIYRELAENPAVAAHPYDSLLLAASLNTAAMCEREMGRVEEAAELHKIPVKMLFDLASKPPQGVNEADVKNFYAGCQLEQFRTWTMSSNPKRVENADKGFGAAIGTWQNLAAVFPQVTMYRDSLGCALLCRGMLRARDPNRREEATADLEESRKILEKRTTESPNIPGPRADLGRTYFGLAKLAKESSDSSVKEWLEKASDSFEKALSMSPDNAQDLSTSQEIKEFARL